MFTKITEVLQQFSFVNVLKCKLGGSVAEWLECWTCNSDAPSQVPPQSLAGFVLFSACKIANWIASFQFVFNYVVFN